MRILVTGSRDLPETEESVVWNAIISAAASLYGNGDDQATIIEGGCPTGADRYARAFVIAASNSKKSPITFHLETHEADWNKYGKNAGPLRNKEMVESGADIAIAFYSKDAEKNNGNRGTKNCVSLIKKANIELVEVMI